MSKEVDASPRQAGELLETIKEANRILDTTKKREYNVKNKLAVLPPDREALILGDFHGDFKTLRNILSKTRFLDKIEEDGNLLVCLGDYIDRGPQQIEVLHFLLKSLISHPDNIVLLRGNHEGRARRGSGVR
jgi:predicted MPP superfamily phosphohydrolase